MNSEGVCKFCNKTISGRAIKKHISDCKEIKHSQEMEKKLQKIYTMKAFIEPFWIYFDIDSKSTLKDIDNFLRNVWLECCGHLSSFEFGNITYDSDYDGENSDGDMKDISLSKVFKPGISSRYQYDFGTTTELNVECISERIGEIKEIYIIARNNMPKIKCSKCGKPPTKICSCCGDLDSIFCDDCTKKNICLTCKEEDMFLPIINSPRTGQCGYTGPGDY